MNYTTIDLSTWKRGDLFRFYIDKMRIVMSLTCDIDVAPLLAYAKKNNLKFYPAMIWSVAKVINSHDEFKYGWRGDDLIRWDYVSPSYAVFNKEDENFTKFVTEYADDLFDFCGRVEDDKRKHVCERAVIKKTAAEFLRRVLPALGEIQAFRRSRV